MGRIANRVSTACRRWKRKEYFRVFHPSFAAERPGFIWRPGTAGRAVWPGISFQRTAAVADRIGRGCFDTGLGTFMPTENLAESARWSLYGLQQAALFTLP